MANTTINDITTMNLLILLLMIQILDYVKDPKLWDLWYIR